MHKLKQRMKSMIHDSHIANMIQEKNNLFIPALNEDSLTDSLKENSYLSQTSKCPPVLNDIKETNELNEVLSDNLQSDHNSPLQKVENERKR